MLLYVAGPLRAKNERTQFEHCDTAYRVAARLWEMGHVPICPHTATLIEAQCRCDFRDYLAGDFKIIARCDGLVLLPYWEESEGAVEEEAYARSLGIPCWEYPDLPTLHTTEVYAPQQVQAFAEELGRMYRLHLSKNQDYSQMNILMTGEIGLVTRLWDKVARLLNLTGWKVTAAPPVFEQPRNPAHEAIEDSYRDLACYGIIGLLLRAGKWGK